MKRLAAVLMVLFSAATSEAAPTTQDECKTAGGTWGKYGMAQIEQCNMPTSDAGKACTKNTDCEAQLCVDDNGNTEHGKCFDKTVKAGCIDTFNAEQAAKGFKTRMCID